MENLAKAVIAVMQEVKSIDKNMTVGSGNYTYKGVSDKDVKQVIGTAMAKHGLCILPIGVKPNMQIDTWDEESEYNGKKTIKRKQSVFTEVITKYLLLHTSGESQVLTGYGHGQDTMDKASGKSTTYALKYTLLYTFLTPTGHIDDTDNEHSEEKPVPVNNKAVAQAPKQEKPKEKLSDERFQKALALTDIPTLEKTLKIFDLTEDQENGIIIRIDELKRENKPEEGRLPALTKEVFDKAKGYKTAAPILKILAEHRMSEDSRNELTELAKKLK